MTRLTTWPAGIARRGWIILHRRGLRDEPRLDQMSKRVREFQTGSPGVEFDLAKQLSRQFEACLRWFRSVTLHQLGSVILEAASPAVPSADRGRSARRYMHREARQ